MELPCCLLGTLRSISSFCYFIMWPTTSSSVMISLNIIRFRFFFQDLLGFRIFIFKVLFKSIQEKYLNFSNPGKWTGIDFDSEFSFTENIISILLCFVKFSFKKSNLKVTNAKRKKKKRHKDALIFIRIFIHFPKVSNANICIDDIVYIFIYNYQKC